MYYCVVFCVKEPLKWANERFHILVSSALDNFQLSNDNIFTGEKKICFFAIKTDLDVHEIFTHCANFANIKLLHTLWVTHMSTEST